MTPLLVANWKMAPATLAEATATVQGMLPGVSAVSGLETVVCPPFPWLVEVSRLLEGSPIQLGAQNMYFEDQPAHTGEVSPAMLAGMCSHVLVGHYERRLLLRETEWLVNRKLQSALDHGIRPILCVGETADQLDEGMSAPVVGEQLEAGIKDLAVDGRLTIAYDPAWTTIGKAPPVPPRHIANVCGYLRDALAMFTSAETAAQVRIIFGGSVTVRNIDDIVAQKEIDGVMVGTASLRTEDFVTIARTIASR